MDDAILICHPKFLRGHKNKDDVSVLTAEIRMSDKIVIFLNN